LRKLWRELRHSPSHTLPPRGKLGSKARALPQHTKEVKGANIVDNGFSSSFAGGDGKPLFATGHRPARSHHHRTAEENTRAISCPFA
jgi:hypothetical protein